MGIVRGRDLAQANRETYPRFVNFYFISLQKSQYAATDLAEVLGMAIGINLLTGLPLIWGVAITVFDTILLLFLQRLGMRKMEAFIIALVAIVAISFLVEIILAKPDPVEVVKGLIPSLPNATALYIAIGIIGATVMPHNLYLHSALVQTRKIQRTPEGIKQALKWNFIDSAIALNIAFFVNAAILILAATVFFRTGRTEVAQIKEAHHLLDDLLGTSIAPILFAVALIAAGQSSTITGTLAGQIVMEGYLRLRINPWIRRLITRLLAIIPACIVIYLFGEDEVDSLLVLSQVILSLQLGFAIIPLIHFVSEKRTMGAFTIKPIVQVLAWLIASILVYLNGRMVVNEIGEFFTQTDNLLWKSLVILGALIFVSLLIYISFSPLFKKKKPAPPITVHAETGALKSLELPSYRKIAVALDFSENDEKLLAHALGQGKTDTHYLLIHVVESASARFLGKDSDDYETRSDESRLNSYIAQLREKGFQAEAKLGFQNRTKEIVRIIKENNADLLVIGAHGHSGVKDWIYGETVNSVRHELKIPVLVVNF